MGFLRVSQRFRRRLVTGRPSDALAQALHDHIEHRSEHQGHDGGGDHAADHRGADGLTAGGAGTGGDDQRHKACDGRDGGHQDRTEAQLCGGYRRIQYAQARFPLLGGELDDQDRVLARKADEQHDADLGIDVVVEVPHQECDNRSQHRQRHDQNHRGRAGPALVLGGQHQEYENDGQREDDHGLGAHFLFLIRHAGPRVTHGCGQLGIGHLLHQRERLTGAESRRRLSRYGRAGEQVVAKNGLRPQGTFHLHQRPHRHHAPVCVPDFEAADVLGLCFSSFHLSQPLSSAYPIISSSSLSYQCVLVYHILIHL